jgi:hypothetical protein
MIFLALLLAEKNADFVRTYSMAGEFFAQISTRKDRNQDRFK